MVVLSDEDDEELVDMASAAAAQGILAGQMDPGFDGGDMRSKLCSIFNRIMDGYKIVNDAYVELWSIIDHSPLQILGKILLDVYMSATTRTMQKEQGDDDDCTDDDEEEPIIIKKIEWEPGVLTSLQ